MSRLFNQLLVVTCVVAGVAAQEPVRVDPAVAAQNLVKRVEPEVPRIAQMANVGGAVRMDVTISTEGRVSNTKILSGHPMLRQAFINAVQQWEYKPFVRDGQPVTAITTVEWVVPTIERSKAENRAIEQFYSVDERCRNLVRQQEWAKAEAECRRSVEISKELPPERILERSGAHTSLGHALLMQKKLDEAIATYQEALRIDSQRREEDDADYASRHANLARAYFFAGRHGEADSYFKRAVTIFEAAIVALPDYKENYSARLKRTLLEWSRVKTELGQQEAAKLLEQKANSL